MPDSDHEKTFSERNYVDKPLTFRKDSLIRHSGYNFEPGWVPGKTMTAFHSNSPAKRGLQSKIKHHLVQSTFKTTWSRKKIFSKKFVFRIWKWSNTFTLRQAKKSKK